CRGRGSFCRRGLHVAGPVARRELSRIAPRENQKSPRDQACLGYNFMSRTRHEIVQRGSSAQCVDKACVYQTTKPPRRRRCKEVPRQPGRLRLALPADEANSRLGRNMWQLCKEFLSFLRQEKKWWLVPLVVILLLLAMLIVFSGGSVLAP